MHNINDFQIDQNKTEDPFLELFLVVSSPDEIGINKTKRKKNIEIQANKFPCQETDRLENNKKV